MDYPDKGLKGAAPKVLLAVVDSVVAEGSAGCANNPGRDSGSRWMLPSSLPICCEDWC